MGLSCTKAFKITEMTLDSKYKCSAIYRPVIKKNKSTVNNTLLKHSTFWNREIKEWMHPLMYISPTFFLAQNTIIHTYLAFPRNLCRPILDREISSAMKRRLCIISLFLQHIVINLSLEGEHGSMWNVHFYSLLNWLGIAFDFNEMQLTSNTFPPRREEGFNALSVPPDLRGHI